MTSLKWLSNTIYLKNNIQYVKLTSDSRQSFYLGINSAGIKDVNPLNGLTPSIYWETNTQSFCSLENKVSGVANFQYGENHLTKNF